MRIPAVLLITSALLISAKTRVHGGDAVMWDRASRLYIAQYSSTPLGGQDYTTGAQAAESVEKIARREGGGKSILIWKSDRTGFFAVWTGLDASQQTLAAVGFGATEVEARVRGLAEIRQAGAQSGFVIAHRYTSYGTDSTADTPSLPDLNAGVVQTENYDSISPDGRFALRTAHVPGERLRRLDLVNLQTFQRVAELGTPAALVGSILWSADSRRFAFLGEERSYSVTCVYSVEGDRCIPLPLPDRSVLPTPDLGLNLDEHIFETTTDSVRPKAWLKSGDLELEHVVKAVVEKGFDTVGTTEDVTTFTIHFDGPEGSSIVGATQAVTRQ